MWAQGKNNHSTCTTAQSKQSFANISNIQWKVCSEYPRHTSDKDQIQTNKTAPLTSHMYYVSVSQIKTVQSQALEQKGRKRKNKKDQNKC